MQKLGIKVHHISTSKRKDDSRTISKQVDYQIITFTVKLDGARGSEHINQLMNNLKARGCVIDRSQFQNKQTSSMFN